MMFIKSEENRYRKFLKQFKKLSRSDKLKAINYIIFSYSEDVYIYKGIDKNLLNNQELKDVTKQTVNILSENPFIDPIKEAVKAFNLNKMYLIPNLLEEQYRVK